MGFKSWHVLISGMKWSDDRKSGKICWAIQKLQLLENLKEIYFWETWWDLGKWEVIRCDRATWSSLPWAASRRNFKIGREFKLLKLLRNKLEYSQTWIHLVLPLKILIKWGEIWFFTCFNSYASNGTNHSPFLIFRSFKPNSCESKNLPVSSSKPILIIETLQCDRDDRPLCAELPPKTDGKKAEGTVQVPNVPHKTSVSDVSAPSV